ncbi:hypothetical protein HELRODRAFT_183479 [Helobdella robusta]|uniref:BEN domain-containing protein n=1 Tax=Helobdella robusta TaxID=6412 RepID=T1FJQ8_HELRO|nr:hypothetical protein HELRODRAFT_183479 [Helobdella robusta]ESO11166.1 hypothetical protein HELRODRAFT_183479 [Helobdella robusta]
MAVSADQQRVKTLLTETIILLCKNGLHFKDEFTVEGLIGITIDKNDVFLINIKETIGLNQPNLNNISIRLDNTPHMKRPLMKKRRFHSTYIMQNVRHTNDSETASDIENPLKTADDLNISASSSLSLSYINHSNPNARQLHLQQHQQKCLNNNNCNNNNNNNNNNTQDINENPVDFSISLNSSKDTSFDSCKYQDTLNSNNNFNDVNNIESKNTGMHTPELNKIDLDNSYQNSQQQQSHHSQYHRHYDNTHNNNNTDTNSTQSQFQIYTDKNDDHEYKVTHYNDSANANTDDSRVNINSINNISNLDHSMSQNDVINHHNVNSSNEDDIINDKIINNHFDNNVCSKSIQNHSTPHISSDCEMAQAVVIKEELNDIELNSQHYNNNNISNNINNNNNMRHNNSNSLHSNVVNSCQSGSISGQKPHRRARHPKSRRYSLIDGSSLDPHNYQLFHDQAEQQVELLPGSGVFITMRAYAYLTKETWNRGSKLVRRVVREVFPDEHILARSSCLGKRLGGCHVGLDHHKVDTIKAFVQQRMPQVSHTEIVAAINECCRDIRAKLRKSFHRK